MLVLKKSQQCQLPPEIAVLLQEFNDVFQEPCSLPTKRSVDHAITLVDNTKTVNQSPYRLPVHQKNAMEDLSNICSTLRLFNQALAHILHQSSW